LKSQHSPRCANSDFAEYFKLSILFIFIITFPSGSLFNLKVGWFCGASIYC